MACINEYISLFGGEPHKAWQRCNADSIVCQKVANNIVDWYVADGRIALQTIQRILGLGSRDYLSESSVKVINQQKSKALVEAIQHERRICNSNMSNKLRDKLTQRLTIIL